MTFLLVTDSTITNCKWMLCIQIHFKKLFFQNQKLFLVSKSLKRPCSLLLPMCGTPEEFRPQLISQRPQRLCRDWNTGQGCALHDRDEDPEMPGPQPEEAWGEGQRRAEAPDSAAALSITSGRSEDDFLFVVSITQCMRVCKPVPPAGAGSGQR